MALKQRGGKLLVLGATLLGVLLLGYVLMRGRGAGSATELPHPSGSPPASSAAFGTPSTSGPPASPLPVEIPHPPVSGDDETPPPALEDTNDEEAVPENAIALPFPSSPSERATPTERAGVPDTDRPPGVLSPEAIQSTVREALPELRFCFEWQLTQHPELEGRVEMEWRILADGTVVEPNVAEDQLYDDTVLRCFRGVVGRLSFPPPEGGEVTVRYPFLLSSVPEARRPEGI